MPKTLHFQFYDADDIERHNLVARAGIVFW